ncbi:HAD family phosphatase [Salmonella enterica]|nr:HAD family phosphatase [Salmonella enterica]EBR3832578.1 HAD family phosphatase [Salmonella enterica]EII2546021.1 HAD family phosphatase [Salmonella enterica]
MLLITDLDGTLLTSQKTISPRTRQALIAFRQDGGLLAACSARPVSSMVRLLRQQQVDTLFSWCAGFNCGRLLEMAGPRIIHAVPLTATDLWNIDQHISLSRYHHHFFSAEAIHHRDDRLIAPWTTYEARLFELPLITETAENIFNRRNIYKITLVAASSEIDTLCTEVNNHLPCGYYAVVTGENYIDIQRSDVNKGCIIEQLIHYLNISSDKVVAIGDQQNDVSMFAAAGISIAMGNAPDAVKRQAGYVTATNDEEGIVHALEWLRCLTHPVTMRQRLTAAKDNESN